MYFFIRKNEINYFLADLNFPGLAIDTFYLSKIRVLIYVAVQLLFYLAKSL